MADIVIKISNISLTNIVLNLMYCVRSSGIIHYFFQTNREYEHIHAPLSYIFVQF